MTASVDNVAVAGSIQFAHPHVPADRCRLRGARQTPGAANPPCPGQQERPAAGDRARSSRARPRCRGAALALRSWTAPEARSAKVPPTPGNGRCPGRTRNAWPKSAGSSHRRARRSSRSSRGCARSGGVGALWGGASRASSPCSAPAPSHSGSDHCPAAHSTPRPSASRGRRPPSRGRARETAAASVVGVGASGQVRGTEAVPVAGLAELLAAYVVLSDHHLAPGADGPSIPVTADAVTAYQAGLASQEAEVPVAAGESLTELEALEGLLVDSGADMATVLADWDAGSVSAFVAKMNTTASALGLTSTHITDPTGVDPATTSTAEDLVRLGEASLSIPVLRQIVSLGQASVPMTTVVFNPNFDLGQDGIIGMKTGSDSSAAGLLPLRRAAKRRWQERHRRRGRARSARWGTRPHHRSSRRRRHLGEEHLRRPPQLHPLRSGSAGGPHRCGLGFDRPR